MAETAECKRHKMWKKTGLDILLLLKWKKECPSKGIDSLACHTNLSALACVVSLKSVRLLSGLEPAQIHFQQFREGQKKFHRNVLAF